VRRRNLIRIAVAIALAAATVAHAASPADADPNDPHRDGPEPVTYLPPVDAPVVDPFRAPRTPYGPGNRGVDYGTEPDQPVTAAAEGEVVFAGHVANELHVVVRHADGIRTSYSFLATVNVRRGDHVDHTTTLGTATRDRPLHFGARAPLAADGTDTYLDPLVLFGQRPGADHPHARLVADPHPERPLTEAEERSLLARALSGVGQAATWLEDRAELTVEEQLELARILLDDAIDLSVPVPIHLVVATLRWRDEQATCTPATTPVPPPPQERRIVILVGGLGSSTGHGAILETDTTALGYDRRRDVHQFNGYAPPPNASSYDAHDSQGDLEQAAARLAAEIRTTQRQHPGVPVDVIAHSQGGLVARAAVVLHGARPALLATLGTPHHGTDAASAAAALDLTESGSRALDLATAAVTDPAASLDLDSRSILQMSETSPFIRKLDDHPLPPPTTTRTVSIAVRGDLVVPNHQSRLAGADNAVITTTGSLNEHDGLPQAAAATTELRRALAGQSPTCRSLIDALADEAAGRQTSQLTDQAAVWATATALYADGRARRP
jgi:hypothetical protein